MEPIQVIKSYLDHPRISIDSRTMQPGDTFIALKGERFDGNDYVQQALDKKAKFVICDDSRGIVDDRLILVDSGLKYLQMLAREYRDYLVIKVIAITGSNGKTTTKELIHSVLNTGFKTHSTKGNFNNHIGVPLTILSTPKETEILVVEMGANHIGEINELCHIAKPDIGIITNIGKAHLEGFGSIEGVLQAKTELYRYLAKNGGKILYNGHDSILSDNMPQSVQSIKYIQGEIGGINPSIIYNYNGLAFHSKLYGDYNVTNIRCAITLGIQLGLNPVNIKNGVEEYVPHNNRSEIRIYKGGKIYMDAYNANPTSMSASIDNFISLQGDKKILILGDMNELGEYADSEHSNILDKIRKHPEHTYIFIGPTFSKQSSDGLGKFYASVDEAIDYFRSLELSDAIVLIKGSRSIGLEKMIEKI